MNFNKVIHQLSAVTRSKDWRFSFVPFIMASVYLWSSLFELRFSVHHLFIFCLSICTTVGFAALGYFINEFFDKADDTAAGKINKLSFLSAPKQLALFSVILIVCFAPWLYLPKDKMSFYLISAEITCFLLYSLPKIRLKKSVFIAGVLDANYAYLIPGLLSYHTYSLLAGNPTTFFPYLFFTILFFIGYRNIILHQIKDVLNDQKIGMNSLPQHLGISKSYTLLRILYLLESTMILAFSIELMLENRRYLIWLIFALAYLVHVRKDFQFIFKKPSYFALLPQKSFLDVLYVLWFPIIQLLLLFTIDWRWLILLPLHALILIDRAYLLSFKNIVWHEGLKPFLSILINYPIYFFFKIFGVDLKKKEMSALQFLKSKFKK